MYKSIFLAPFLCREEAGEGAIILAIAASFAANHQVEDAALLSGGGEGEEGAGGGVKLRLFGDSLSMPAFCCPRDANASID